MKGPLQGLRIVEIKGIGPAPFCGMHFADLGAEVILIEREGPPFNDGLKGLLKRGKRSVTMDLKDPVCQQKLLKLIKSADGLIEGMRPGVMERLGLGPDICLKENPKLIYGRITGWGQEGPLSQTAGHDNNYASISSALFLASAEGQAPIAPPTLLADIGGGAHYLMIGMLSALRQVQETGKGDVIDAAMVDGSAHMMNLVLDLVGSGAMNGIKRGIGLLDGPHYYHTYVCSDGGYITFGALEKQFYVEFLGLMGLQVDPDFNDQHSVVSWPKQKAKLAGLFVTKPRDHWVKLFEGSDACIAPVLNVEEAVQHPHNVARNVFFQDHGYVEVRAAPCFQNYDTPTPPDIPEKGGDNEWLEAELAKL